MSLPPRKRVSSPFDNMVLRQLSETGDGGIYAASDVPAMLNALTPQGRERARQDFGGLLDTEHRTQPLASELDETGMPAPSRGASLLGDLLPPQRTAKSLGEYGYSPLPQASLLPEPPQRDRRAEARQALIGSGLAALLSRATGNGDYAPLNASASLQGFARGQEANQEDARGRYGQQVQALRQNDLIARQGAEDRNSLALRQYQADVTNDKNAFDIFDKEVKRRTEAKALTDAARTKILGLLQNLDADSQSDLLDTLADSGDLDQLFPGVKKDEQGNYNLNLQKAVPPVNPESVAARDSRERDAFLTRLPALDSASQQKALAAEDARGNLAKWGIPSDKGAQGNYTFSLTKSPPQRPQQSPEERKAAETKARNEKLDAEADDLMEVLYNSRSGDALKLAAANRLLEIRAKGGRGPSFPGMSARQIVRNVASMSPAEVQAARDRAAARAASAGGSASASARQAQSIKWQQAKEEITLWRNVYTNARATKAGREEAGRQLMRLFGELKPGQHTTLGPKELADALLDESVAQTKMHERAIKQIEGKYGKSSGAEFGEVEHVDDDYKGD
jgi:hypothetical protein